MRQATIDDFQTETVYVVHARGNGEARNRYHTDPDCDRLNRARSYTDKDADLLPANAKICKLCSGEWEPPSSDQNSCETRQHLLELDADDVGLS